MVDKAHRATDKKLAEMESHLEGVYEKRRRTKKWIQI